MKKDIKSPPAVKSMFAGESDEVEEKKIIKKKWTLNEGIFIDTLRQDTIEAKRTMRLELKSQSWMKRNGVLVKLVPKWSNKSNVRL